MNPKNLISAFSDWLQYLRTDRVIDYIVALDPMHNPWVLTTAAAFIILCLWAGWRLLLAVFFCLMGLALMLLTFSNHAAGQIEQNQVLLLMGGGIVIVLLLLYNIFFSND